MKFASRLVHPGAIPGDPHHPIATPIYQTATFEQERADACGAYDYSRSGNPTRSVLEEQLARLENGKRAFAFASGMAAITTVTRLLAAGEEILAGDDLYGGSYRLFSHLLDRSGIATSYANAADLERFAAGFTPRTRLVFIETPTNPLFRIVDIAAVAELAHQHGALLCVDNSMLSPYLQNPLDLGADLVVHSATKFLCGHSDVTGGVVVVNDESLAERIYFTQNAEGNCLSPFDCYLLLRGLKTLKVRLDCQQQNTAAVVRYLRSHELVTRVHYPGLENHPGHALHFAQARGGGAVLSFETGSPSFSRRLVELTRLFQTAVSFGSVSSSISLPGCMSHASIPEEVRSARSLSSSLVRLSIGVEDVQDLINDLEQALRGAEASLTRMAAADGEAKMGTAGTLRKVCNG